MPTCRNCLREFDAASNNPTACRIHPELYSGETSQRWKEPGDTKYASTIYYFYSCCGNPNKDSAGCCYSAHISFSDTNTIEQRQPGMGVLKSDVEFQKMLSNFVTEQEAKVAAESETFTLDIA